ncbi:MAG: hypothetical protein MUP47_06980 [Phycisphaerae bacterium]|nr:hypothetical protein [Phycisphaerae bacterium]
MAWWKRTGGAMETAVGAAILAALAAIAATIVARQVNYRSVFLTSLDFPSPASPGAAAPEVDLSAYAPEGFAPMSAAESFGPEDLYNKIDGRADLYLTAGVVALRCQRFAERANAESWMEVYVYDMHSADNAFTVYSKQKRPEAAELTALTYQTSSSLHFVHGRYYVEIVTGSGSETILRAEREYRQKFIASVPGGPGPATQDAGLFPAGGLQAGSIWRAGAEDFGVKGFEGTFLATFQVHGTTVIAFLARRPSPEAAAQAAAAYRESFRSFGATIELAPAEVPGGSVITMLGTTKLVFSCGPFVAGVHESPNRPAAQKVAAALYAALAEAHP